MTVAVTAGVTGGGVGAGAGAGVVGADELASIDRAVLDLIELAVVQAKAVPLPTAADLTTDVYVSY